MNCSNGYNKLSTYNRNRGFYPQECYRCVRPCIAANKTCCVSQQSLDHKNYNMIPSFSETYDPPSPVIPTCYALDCDDGVIDPMDPGNRRWLIINIDYVNKSNWYLPRKVTKYVGGRYKCMYALGFYNDPSGQDKPEFVFQFGLDSDILAYVKDFQEQNPPVKFTRQSFVILPDGNKLWGVYTDPSRKYLLIPYDCSANQDVINSY